MPQHDLWLFDGIHQVDVTYVGDGSSSREITDDPDAVGGTRGPQHRLSLAVPFGRYAAGLDDWPLTHG